MNLTEHLSNQEYPGRFIAIGKAAGGGVMAIYGATGRHEASLARKYVRVNGDVHAIGTDQKILAQGNVDLLEYRAVRAFKGGVVVANGKQGDSVRTKTIDSFAHDLRDYSYEPDKHRTPRITALMKARGDKIEAALHIVRSRFDGTPLHESWTVPLEDGKARYIATYDGKDVRPTPSFFGQPVVTELPYESAEEAAQKVYDSLAPKPGQKDYRVGVVAVYMRDPKRKEVVIVNKN